MVYMKKTTYLIIFCCFTLNSININALPLIPALNTPPSNEVLPGKIIWADIFTADVNETIHFYTKVFGWTVEEFELNNDNFYLLMNMGKPVAGVIPRLAVNNISNKAVWVNHLSTPDINQAIKKATELGAEVIFSPNQFGKRGIDSIISDPLGGLIGMLKSDSGDPKDNEPVIGDWVWAQLFSSNVEKAAKFYSSVFDYTIQQASELNIKDTFFLMSANKARAGLAPLPTDIKPRDRWVGFIRVNNINQILDRSKAEGARVIFPPQQAVFNGQIAIIADPSGALLGLLSKTDSE